MFHFFNHRFFCHRNSLAFFCRFLFLPFTDTTDGIQYILLRFPVNSKYNPDFFSAFLYQFCILKAFFLLYMAPYPHTPFIYSEIILLFQKKITVFFKFSVFLTLFTVDEHMPSYCYTKKFFLFRMNFPKKVLHP